MAHGRMQGRRWDRRVIRPTLDGTLEPRLLMSQMAEIRSQTAAGGQAVVVTNTNGQEFYISVSKGGTIRAYPSTGGRVSLVADGTNSSTNLEINQIIPVPISGRAHIFNTALQNQTGVINIASITVTTGQIDAIEGYHDAVLSGPIVAKGTNTVDRIAFQSIVQGGSISVGGTLNTLDVLENADFSSSLGLYVGQDLNWFEVGGNLSVENGASVVIGRDLGLIDQPAKGSGLTGQGLFVGGNLRISAPSNFAIGRFVDFGVEINGNLAGGRQISISGTSLTSLPGNFLVLGTVSG